MQKNGIEIEILNGDNQPRNLPVTIQADTLPQQRDFASELATALIAKENELDNLKLRFLDSELSGKEKLNEILKFKSMLMLPSLKNSMGFYIDSELLRGSVDVMAILTSIEATIKNIIQYEEQENIDFNHPKIIAGMNMLFELMMECVLDVVREPVILREIAEKCAIRSVGIENELNKTFKGVANKMAQAIDNPLTEAFKSKNTDTNTALEALKDSLKRADKLLDNDLGRDNIKNKIKELMEALNNE